MLGTRIFEDANFFQTEEGLAAAALQDEVIEAILEAVEGINITVFDEFPVEQDVSFADWVAQKGLWEYPSVQALCSQISSSIVGREPREVGAHYFFDYLKSGGGLLSLLSEGKLGAQSLMIKEGQYLQNARRKAPPRCRELVLIEITRHDLHPDEYCRHYGSR